MTTQFFSYNLINQSTTTLTASSENAQFPTSNLKNPRTTKNFRSVTGVLTTSIVIDTITGEPVDSVLAVGSHESGFQWQTMTIEANIVDTWTAPPFSDSITLSAEDIKYNFVLKSITEQNYRFWRITITNSSGYVGLSKIFLGKSESLANNDFLLGWKHSSKDLSKIQTNRYGQRFIDIIEKKQKGFSASLKLLTNDEMETINDIWEYNGKRIPLWIVVDSEEKISNDYQLFSYYCYFTKEPIVTNNNFSLYDMSITTIEAI